MNESMDGWIFGSMDGWIDGWMDGWIDGWMDGWIFLSSVLVFVFRLPGTCRCCRAEDGGGGDGAGVRDPRLPSGHAHPQARPPVGTHEERKERQQVRGRSGGGGDRDFP